MSDVLSNAAAGKTNEAFFVVGSPRSGTTLLERILNRHSRLFVPPETEFFHLLKRHGLLGKAYLDREAAQFLDVYLDSRPAKMLGLREDAKSLKQRLLENSSSYKDLFITLMETLREPSQRPRWGEKTPHHLRTGDAILNLFPTAKMIAVLRDGRAVTRSRLMKPGWEKNHLVAARVWQNDSQRLVELLNSDHAQRILVVRYEELVGRASDVVPRVCGFLGETFEPQMLDPNASEETRFGSYYEQSWMAKADRAIDPATMDAWRSAFTDRELALINHLQGDGLRHWGYSVDQLTHKRGWRVLLIKEQLRHAIYRVQRRIADSRLSNVHTGVKGPEYR